MFTREAQEIGLWIGELPAGEIAPVIDIGSGGLDYRQKDRSWIDGEIFAPLRERGVRIVHLDIDDRPGVDVVADLFKDEDLKRVADLRPGLVLLANVLEHVEEPAALLDRAMRVLKPGGRLLVTVPRSYPEHRAPIDNGLRPSPEELAAMAPQASVLRSMVLPTEYHWDEIARDPKKLMVRKLKWLFTPYLVTMVLFQRRD